MVKSVGCKREKIVSLDYIDNFYSWILEYGLVHPNDFNDKVHTILKSINSIDDLKKDYFDASDDIDKDRIKKHCDFIERIQSDVLEQKNKHPYIELIINLYLITKSIILLNYYTILFPENLNRSKMRNMNHVLVLYLA